MKKAYQLKQNENESCQTFNHEEKQSYRINKYLSMSGYCSRRGADKLIQDKCVTIDGIIAQTGSQVFNGQVVAVNGIEIKLKSGHVYIALNKPVGITCTTELDITGNIIDFMNYKERIFPIGRLDKDSSGLILLTSDGDIVNKILRAENNNEKEYIVNVNRNITPEFLNKIRAGVEITNMRTKKRVLTNKCIAEQINPHCFKLVLTQGYNRQIRRMCTELGYRVTDLQRVRIMNISLGDLKTGQWRYLTNNELQKLMEL